MKKNKVVYDKPTHIIATSLEAEITEQLHVTKAFKIIYISLQIFSRG